MKKRLVIILLSIIPFFVFAQPITLNWLADRIITVGEDSITVKAFEGGEYIDGSQLPYYIYSKHLTTEEAENYEYQVNLTDVVYSAISADLDTSYLSSDFKVTSTVTSARKNYSLEIIIVPFKKDGDLFKLESFNINIEKKSIIKLKTATSWFAENSVLAEGNWSKVGVKTTGIYKLSYSQLTSMGLTPSTVSVFMAQPNQLSTVIQDYVDDLKEIPIFDNGSYILFYAQAPDVWEYDDSNNRFIHKQHSYWNENYYYLSDDVGQKKRIETQELVDGTATTTYTSYIDYGVIEPQIASIDESGDDWYSQIISDGNSFSHTFKFNNILEEPAQMVMRLAARSISASHIMTTYIDGEKQGNISLQLTRNGHTDMAAYETTKVYSFTPQSDNITASMSFASADNLGEGYVDYFSVNVYCDLSMVNDYLLFRNYPSTDDIAKYQIKNTSSSTVVWDITNSYDIESITPQFSGSTSSFKTHKTTINEFVAVNTSGNFSSPTIYGKIKNQNLHGMDVPDMIILTVTSFMDEAENLAKIHRDEGLDVNVIDQADIFTEFAGGKADVTAIRWFMKSLYDRGDKFKYLLLLGDADVNNRMYEGDQNRLMCYESNESLNRSTFYVSDDYFGLLDDAEGQGSKIESSDKVDIGIGRIPVNSLVDVETVTKKLDYYLNDSKKTAWTNSICIVADDQDDNIHVNDADKLAEKLRLENPAMAIKKVYIDAFEQITEASGATYPDAKSLIDRYIEEGVLIWGYSGHGSPTGLSGEGVMRINDINNYENMANLPLWVTATCDFCPYDHNEEVSSGERVLLSTSGGGIGLFTTTRLVYSTSNYVIANNFYSYVLNVDSNKEKLRLGDVVRLTKQATAPGPNKRKFALIGDPALQLIHADSRWTVETDSINGIVIDEFTDTLQALSQVTISGHIAKSDASIDETYNGVLYPTVYDKISTLKTLGNDSDSDIKDFLLWNSTLFSGKTKVVNGLFTFSFLLPKDIDYNSGKGRIEYLATSDVADVNGYYEDFYIGGFYNDYKVDNTGPEMTVYMNSPNFSNGDIVNPNPILIADISDVSGINTSGNSVGHDITLKLNNDANTIETINTSYVSDVSDYKKGRITYALKDLEEGDYTLTLKLWDVQNNSATKTINFTVSDDAIPNLTTVYCYPNPVSLSSGKEVRFVALHDRPDNTLGVKINIYDASARIIYQSTNYSYTENNEVYFDWNPSSSSINAGLFFYRISIVDGDKISTGKSEKLLITN